MYLRDGDVLAQGGGGSVAVQVARPLRFPDRGAVRRGLDRAAELDLVVDLGARIGSRDWWRGLATCVALCAVTIAFRPDFAPVPGRVAPPMTGAQAQEMRAQRIAPYAYGADSGRRTVPTALAEPLADTPERPSVSLTATLGQGDGFARVLERAGVGDEEAHKVADLVARAVALGEIKAGTKLDLTLGRRPNRKVARPLDHLAFRAKFDLALEVNRVDGELVVKRIPIAVDNTPLRITGRVGGSLFAAARAAGAPARAIETYLRALGQHVSIARDVGSNDRFDLIIEHRRAATGETEVGGLLYAGLEQSKRKVRLLKWTQDGREQWFDATGVGEQRGQMRVPVVGRQTSGFGLRRHPLLGYSRMHQGIDYGAAMGSPIVAATDGVVSFAGWHGGHGNYVQIRHAGNLGTGYAHMSRIVAKSGQKVRAGQVIGYVGSTGLSTGPHLHFEVFQNNRAVNPKSVKFTQAAQLSGAELARFKAQLSRLMAVKAS